MVMNLKSPPELNSNVDHSTDFDTMVMSIPSPSKPNDGYSIDDTLNLDPGFSPFQLDLMPPSEPGEALDDNFAICPMLMGGTLKPPPIGTIKPPPVEGTPLAIPADEAEITALHYLLFSNLQVCAFAETDRSKSRDLPIGHVGVACRHCSNQPNRPKIRNGRWFPSDVMDVKYMRCLYNHMLKCEWVPKETINQLTQAHQNYDIESSHLKWGAQKAFFSKIWKRSHGLDTKTPLGPSLATYADKSPEVDTFLYLCFSNVQAIAFSNIDENRTPGRYQHLPIGYPGFACRHCNANSTSVGRFARWFPKKMEGSCQYMIFNHLIQCDEVPKERAIELKEAYQARNHETSGVQNVFLSNMWNRLHGSKILTNAWTAQDEKPLNQPRIIIRRKNKAADKARIAVIAKEGEKMTEDDVENEKHNKTNMVSGTIDIRKKAEESVRGQLIGVFDSLLQSGAKNKPKFGLLEVHVKKHGGTLYSMAYGTFNSWINGKRKAKADINDDVMRTLRAFIKMNSIE